MKKETKFTVGSPHLTVYRPQMTSLFSIFQRISGVLIFMYFFAALIFKFAENYYFSYYSFYALMHIFYDGNLLLNSFILLFGLSFFMYHIFNGLKIIFFETPLGVNYLNLKYFYSSNGLVLATAVVMTALVWLMLCL